MRKQLNRIVPALATLVAAVSLAACGEKEEPATTGAQVTQQTSTAQTSTAQTTTSTTTEPDARPATPEAVVTAFLSSPDAERVCDELLSPAFVRKAYGDRAGCLGSRGPNSLAGPSTRLTATGNGSTISVTAQPRGGVYDGDKLQITLIRQGDALLIDAIRSNAPVGP